MLNEIKDFVIKKQEMNCNTIGSAFIHSTDNGKFGIMKNCGWTGGFTAGTYFLCYELSGKEIFKKTAEEFLPKLEKDLDEKGTKLGHDIGMLFSPASYADYKITGSEYAKALTIKAGETLIKRFKTNGNYIQAWDCWGESKENETRMIIDCMYNLPLLFRCYELTNDKKFYDAAYKHAKTAQKFLVRSDFTTPHTFVFNQEGTGGTEKTHQGYADDSCWARGQGWAITGFAMAYRFTKDESFLETSKGCAKKFLELTEPNLIPKLDLIFQGRFEVPRDTSAANIIANGFMEIFDATGDNSYKEVAEKILIELYKNYSTKNEPENQGLIKEATGHMPGGININVTLNYGDYYFVELLGRIMGVTKGYW